MRKLGRFEPMLGRAEIGGIQIDVKSRDDIPAILLGLQGLYLNEALREAIFELLLDRFGEDRDLKVGRPGMELWTVLVLAVLKQGLGCDFDRLREHANTHVVLRQLLGHSELERVEIFYGVNARIWANPVSCSHITFFVGCSLLPPNRKSTGIRTIRTTPTLRGANQSSRTETHTPNPLLPLDLHYSIRNVHPLEPVTYSYDQVIRNVSLLDEDTLRDINELVVRHGHNLCDHNVGERLAGRCDSFVVETDVHYPTDRNLLWDAARVMVRIAAALADEWDLSAWRQAKHHAVTLRRLYQRVANTRRSEVWREDVDAFLAKCEELLAKAEATRADPLERGAWPEELEDLDRYIAHTRRQIDQTDRRILQGEVIPQKEKVLSVFEEHTRWISKGKAGLPVELGVPVAIVEDQYQFILEHQILWQGGDTDAAVPVIEATRLRFPELLACSFDRGFHSPQNQAALGDTLELNAMPAKGRLSASRSAHEAQPDFALARQQHPAVESAINNLEQRGLDRVRTHIGIGGHLAVPPLPHHRAYGSVPRRFDRIKRRRGHSVRRRRAFES